jgi:hypothetical protein
MTCMPRSSLTTLVVTFTPSSPSIEPQIGFKNRFFNKCGSINIKGTSHSLYLTESNNNPGSDPYKNSNKGMMDIAVTSIDTRRSTRRAIDPLRIWYLKAFEFMLCSTLNHEIGIRD